MIPNPTISTDYVFSEFLKLLLNGFGYSRAILNSKGKLRKKRHTDSLYTNYYVKYKSRTTSHLLEMLSSTDHNNDTN